MINHLNGSRTEPHEKFARLCYTFIFGFVLLCAHLANYLDAALAIHPVGRSTVHYDRGFLASDHRAYRDKALDSDVDDADREQDK